MLYIYYINYACPLHGSLPLAGIMIGKPYRFLSLTLNFEHRIQTKDIHFVFLFK